MLTSGITPTTFMVQFVGMEEAQHEQSRLTDIGKRLRGMHTLDRIALIVLVIAVVVAALLLTQHFARNREITAAKITANKIVTALGKQDTKTIVALGDSGFQKSTTASALAKNLVFTYNNQQVSFADLYGKTKPTLDWKAVANNAAGQHVVFIYKYTSLKVPFYARIDTIRPAGKAHWYLQALSFNTDETTLQTGVTSSDNSTDQTQSGTTKLTQSI